MVRMLALLLATAPIALAAQSPAPPPAPKDALTDPSFKAPQVIAFIGLKPGDKVADIVAGRFVRALSQAVGPQGRVYAVEPAEIVKAHPQGLQMLQGLAAMPEYRNVTVSAPPINAPALPNGLDAVFIRQNYHDLHDKFMGPADVAAVNKAIYAALKPGGVYVVLDHAALAGSGLAATDTTHRIDPATVKAEVLAAGFRFDGESKILANPQDAHDKNVFDPSIRGQTDQFLYRFRKPR
jgi:predicted methyltransferase